MIVRRLLFTALRMAANNPAMRKQAAKAAEAAVEAARPSLLKASRRAGEAVRSASDELRQGVAQFKAGMQGEKIIPPDDDKSTPKKSQNKRPTKNITPRD